MFKHLFWPLAVALLCSFNGVSQIIQPGYENRHTFGAGVGLDHNLMAVTLSYCRHIPKAKTGAIASITQGTALLGTNNLKMEFGLRSWQGSFNRLNLCTQATFVFVNSENIAGKYKALGLNGLVNIGPQWKNFGFGAEIMYTPFFATKIVHSDAFRNQYYSAVKDGWFSNTSQMVRLGTYAAGFIDRNAKLEIFLRCGYQTSGEFDQFIPPYYAILGVNKTL